MKNLKELIKYTLWSAILLLTISSCKDDIPEELDGYKIETEISVDGEDTPKTKAENSMGWTTGDGVYHKNDWANVAAYAKSGYELVAFYAKDGEGQYQGKSSYNVQVTKNQTFKAEFRSAATYCINCSITNPTGGTVTGTGCGKKNGTYTLTATPNTGWSSSWTTKQVTVSGADINTYVSFTKTSKTGKVSLKGEKVGSYGPEIPIRCSGSGTFDIGTQITIKSWVMDNPNGQPGFEGWYNGNECLSSNPEYTYTVTGDVILVAKWIW